MDSNLHTVRDNVHELETRFDKLRNEVILKLNECSDCIKSAKYLCHQAKEITTVLENKLINTSNEEKEWKDIKVKLATTSMKGMVILNVGGDKYTTSIETLTCEKNTFFTALFSEQWQLEKDPDDRSIFIDRNGTIFTYILEYLRTNMLPDNVMNDKSLLKRLIVEAEYFRLHSLMDRLGVIYFPNGSLLELVHQKRLNEFYGKIYQRWELIYKASRDGFDGNTFHSHCNNKGPTMTIIETNNNYLFGGYTAISWTSGNHSYKNDTTAFLFTLINPHNISPTKYLINPRQRGCAVYHHRDDGPIFGGIGYFPPFRSDNDIAVKNDSNSNNASYIDFPFSYLDTTGKGNNTFTGARNFTTSDIEVFKLA
ncbi:unnamed protein product [Rotaria sp. Silwood1]|nr:unnamed protein product [Rotaria sp. Silwood1]CAF1370687.1 unnamed protein product [Rotaria sp. Silwood1]CAF3498462.1 unnamed protein product [Rotaria sp. Silwood1]CAF3601467.1 unnamed protein product [Rotaria sp. Silwood1]CAF3601654.1 unnamed protein product [Rotaria sp. Silwood1]